MNLKQILAIPLWIITTGMATIFPIYLINAYICDDFLKTILSFAVAFLISTPWNIWWTSFLERRGFFDL